MTASLPETMRAAVYRERGRLSIERRPVPEPGPEDALLRVDRCGVCGTDLHLVMEGWGRPDSIGGHEYSGTIAALGSGVLGWKIGDRVVGGSQPGCGDCECCRAGRAGLCTARGGFGLEGFQGAFAEFKRVPQSQLVRVPPGLSTREAALCEPLAVALHAITLSRIRPGRRALVTGAGPIGLLVVAALRAFGVDDVQVSEPSPVRRALAERVGAARTLRPDELGVPRMPFDAVERPVHVVFECSGRAEALETALAQLGRLGTLVIVGSGMQRPRLDANRVMLNELVVTGSYNYDDGGFEDALALLSSGRLPTRHLIEPEEVPLEGLLGAMERLVAGEIGGKVMVAPNPERE